MSLSDTALSLSPLSRLQHSLPIEFNVNFLMHVQRVDGFFSVLLLQRGILAFLNSALQRLDYSLCSGHITATELLHSLHKVNNPEAIEQGLRMPRYLVEGEVH